MYTPSLTDSTRLLTRALIRAFTDSTLFALLVLDTIDRSPLSTYGRSEKTEGGKLMIGPYLCLSVFTFGQLLSLPSGNLSHCPDVHRRRCGLNSHMFQCVISRVGLEGLE